MTTDTIPLIQTYMSRLETVSEALRTGRSQHAINLLTVLEDGLLNGKTLSERSFTATERAFAELLDDLRAQAQLATSKIKAGDIDGSLKISVNMFQRLGGILDKAKGLFIRSEMDTSSIDMPAKRLNEEIGSFAGHAVFEVSDETFCKSVHGKVRSDRYVKHLGEDPNCEPIREYGLKNPGKRIIIKNAKTGAMSYYRNYQ